MHVFLTGDVQVGKSTLIRKIVESRPDLRLGGFRSVTVADIPCAIGAVYIVRADSGTGPGWAEAAKERCAGRISIVLPNEDSSDSSVDDGTVTLIDDQVLREDPLDEKNRIGIRWGPDKGAEGFPDVFETRGVELLKDAEDCDLILMDEIGWMEGNTTLFRERIMRLVEASVPILGVVQKRWNTQLQEYIRNHPRVKLITVDRENRDNLETKIGYWLDLPFDQAAD